MKPGDLVQIRGDTVPMYRDWEMGKGSSSSHVGYVKNGSTGVLMTSDCVDRGLNLMITFHQILMPQFGPVWIRGAWVYEVGS